MSLQSWLLIGVGAFEAVCLLLLLNGFRTFRIEQGRLELMRLNQPPKRRNVQTKGF